MASLSPRDSAVILVKAAPRVGETHGELVCCAGLDFNGNWIRLYPVAFRTLEDAQKFGRWDTIEYGWSLPKGDQRSESRRLEHKSLVITGSLSEKSRAQFLARHVVPSLNTELEEGRSLALIRPKNPEFVIERKDVATFENEKARFRLWHDQEANSLFGFLGKSLVPYEPAPFLFKYKYETADGAREGTCQDWEIEATFLKWQRIYGETDTLRKMTERFGVEYSRKGFVLAMGTHKAYPQWLINGVIRLDHGVESEIQESLF
ncbi:hypothetical protein LB577_11255 [Mesorhizobium sp. B283B1A]|uniref:hypothetical protein n=1 Tax=Mesorhizobium TaxID=68287 RepID=UPI001CD0702F|nr:MULTISPECIES: hypothetical protein [Mesorhizobium]MCA0047522.1 hypothetical protein [Mesorhizobium sp. B283B1A]UQS63168.1 hypothetical protein M5D98_23970 [Mesorhizobium opportunistum]